MMPDLSRAAKGTTTRSGVRNSVRSTDDPRAAWVKAIPHAGVGQCVITVELRLMRDRAAIQVLNGTTWIEVAAEPVRATTWHSSPEPVGCSISFPRWQLQPRVPTLPLCWMLLHLSLVRSLSGGRRSTGFPHIEPAKYIGA